MLTIKPGEHGSTYGGNPLACRVATEALRVLVDEQMDKNAQYQGNIFRQEIIRMGSKVVSEVRGKGLLNAVVIHNPVGCEDLAWKICLRMAELGKMKLYLLKICLEIFKYSL